MRPFLLSPADSSDSFSTQSYWQPLQYLNLYRTGLSSLLVYLFYSGNLFTPLASTDPRLFLAAANTYFLMSLIFWSMILSRGPSFYVQVYIQITTDIAALILLMHASGGLQSGLGTLMVVTIAAGSILMQGRISLLFAAFGALAVLGEQLYSSYVEGNAVSAYPYAGSLGIAFFATAFLTQILARRIRDSEAQARKHRIDLANMAQLTETIIQRMQTGILVVDAQFQIRLLNESAWHMLGMPATGGNPTLRHIAPELHEQLRRWIDDSGAPTRAVHITPAHVDIMPRFSRIGTDLRSGVLIYLEDTSALAQQAQQLQLASLGRLTASIAHEIRNPLGAISHAGQLLRESEHLDKHDRRLLQIIDDHSGRLNTIVENIMQISRRQHSHIERFELRKFIEQFLQDLCHGQGLDMADFSINIDPPDVTVRFDASHLRQILVNLCENALRHSKTYEGSPRVELLGGISPDFNRPYLDVYDHGTGVSDEVVQHLFEPFFTTETTGTGLGLYLSRQLAESNQAHLSYIRMPAGGTCFRLTFQDPRRQIIREHAGTNE